MIPGSANPLLLASAAAEPTAYQISRSVRFNSSDSAYLSRTPSVAGNRKTWTWAGWVKISKLGIRNTFFSSNVNPTGNPIFELKIESEKLWATGGISNISTDYEIITQAVFRDCSSWMHIVFSFDSTEAIATDRTKLYVNGQRITAFDSSLYPTQYPSLNYESAVNNTYEHRIGRSPGSNYADSYLADIHFIDGQALGPTSFGEFDANGVWQPKAYTGTYPGNSFHLPFSDNSTAAALGTDTSGNSNTWTVNNISVAAGSGNDSLVDTPTNYGTDTGAGGEVRGNYCTWNPLQNTCTLTNGNLDAAYGSGTFSGTRGTFYVSSGKWYWEVTVGTIITSVPYRIGIAKPASSVGSGLGGDANSYNYSNDGSKSFNGTNSAYGASYAGGDIIGVALDLDTGTLVYYKNGVSQGTAFTSVSGLFTPAVELYTGQTSGPAVANFGQRPFAYTAPSGFKALCTTNLPITTITTSGSYTGNGVADGPFVYLNGVPTAMTVNGNAVTFGTHADKLSNGFKIRTTSTTYNQNASIYNYSITSTGDPFKTARAQ